MTFLAFKLLVFPIRINYKFVVVFLFSVRLSVVKTENIKISNDCEWWLRHMMSEMRWTTNTMPFVDAYFIILKNDSQVRMQTELYLISVRFGIIKLCSEVFNCITRFKLQSNWRLRYQKHVATGDALFSSFQFLAFTDSVSFNHHSVIEPRIVHARHKRSIENTLEKVRNNLLLFLAFRRRFTFFMDGKMRLLYLAQWILCVNYLH